MSAKGLLISLCVAVTLLLGTSYGATGQIAVSTRYQTLEGFGAAGAWYEGWLTAHPQRETLYNLLFDQLGLDIYRVRNTYDYDSGYMSRTQTIVNEALQRNPNLKILISSWSPPPYLKSTGDLNGDNGTLIGGPSNYDYIGFAQWWADSITAWSGYGVDADYVGIQNEPDWNGNDRCLFNPTENSTRAGYNQAFEAVYNEMHSRFGSSMPKMIGPETVSFTGAGAYINAMINQSHAYGYAHHLYGPSDADHPDGYISGMTSFAATYGSKPLFQTEFAKLEAPGAIYFSDEMNLAKLIHNSLTVEGVVSYFYWDLYWGDSGGLVTLIQPWGPNPAYTINPSYYAFKHYAKFTDPGWQRVYATENSADLRMSAYISPSNQQVAAVIINTGGSDVSLDLSFNGFSITSGTVYRSTSSQNCANVGSYTGGSLSIPAQSITTLSLTGTGDVTPPSAPTGLNATAGNFQVNLNWNDNSEGDLDGYNVYRSMSYGGPYSQINGSLVTSSDYVDNTVTAGTRYYYVVTAVDMSTNESGYSNQSSAIPYDGTPPAAPTALLATADNGSVSLDWLDNSEGDLDGYNVYRSTTSGSGYSKLNGPLVSNSFYTDNSVTNETTYYYVVTAEDTSSNESGYSTEVSATPSNNPPSIYNFEDITASDTEYNAFACNVDTFPFGGSSANMNSKTEATDQQYTDISANDTAEWATADAGFFNQTFLWVEMKINEAPQNISRIDLTFNGNTSGTADVIHRIYVMKAGTDWTLDSSWVQVGSDMSIEPDVDTTMSRTISSDFSTYINDANGKIIWGVYETTSSEVMNINYLEMTVIAAGDIEAPAAPTGLVATAGDGTVSLDWNSNSEGDLDGYNVYRSTTQGSGYSKINGSLLGSSDYTDNSATNGTTYYYVVTAQDISLNESGYSNEDYATPADMTAPSAPTGLAAYAGDGTVSLNWNDNGEGDLDGYNIYRSITSGSGYTQLNGSLLSTSDYTDNSVTNDTTYYYVVTAEDTSSNESGYSNEDSATPTDTTAPAAPTGLAAIAGDGTVSLNWNDNGEGDLDGYNIYRSITSGSGYTQLNGPLLTTSDYTDNSVSNGTMYYYVVTAADYNSNESGYSNEASARPNIPGSEVEIIGSWSTGTSHTKENGINRALIFIAHGESTSSMNLSSATYGGQSMQKVLDYNYNAANGYAYAAAFILDEAGISAASTNTFNPTWGGTAPGSAEYASVFLANVDQANPTGATDDGGSTSNPVTTGPMATSNGDMVILAATSGNANTYTLNNGFTEGTDQEFGSTATGATGYKSATGSNETPSASFNSTINRQMIIGFVVQAVAGAVDEPPAAPTGLTASPDDNQVSLNWADNGEGDLAGYYVYRSTTPGDSYSQLNGSPLSNSDYIDNTASNYETYFYVVTAIDTGDNESDYSDEASATPDLYQNCTEVQLGGDALVSDLTGDCYVNLEDLEIVSTHWLDSDCGSSGNCGGADFAPTDGDVDLQDFSDFAMDWLKCNDPGVSGCIRNWQP